MAKDNDDGASGSGDGRVPSSSGKPNRKLRSKPYDANNVSIYIYTFAVYTQRR